MAKPVLALSLMLYALELIRAKPGVSPGRPWFNSAAEALRREGQIYLRNGKWYPVTEGT